MSSTARHVANYAVTKVDRLYVDDTGSEADPAIHIANDNGIYSETGDDLSFSVKGVKRMKLDENSLTVVPRLLLPAGTVTAPALSFSADDNTGFYSVPGTPNTTIFVGTNGVVMGRFDGGAGQGSSVTILSNDTSSSVANALIHARTQSTRAGGFLVSNNVVSGTVQLYFGTRFNSTAVVNQGVIQFSTTSIDGGVGSTNTADDYIQFDETNGVTIAKNLRLPTSGGTASALNYYEEYSATAQVLGSVNGVNVFTTTVNTTVTIVRVGKHITIHIDSFTGTMAFNDLLYVTWPVRFGCLVHNQLVACTVNGVASTQVLGNCFGGSVTFTKTIVASNFNATEVVNIFATAFPVVKS
jgi:hypothetical protein